MLFKWEQKYTTIAIYCCAVSAVIVSIVFIGINFGNLTEALRGFIKVISPLIYGFVIAYFANPFMSMLENKVLRFIGRKKARSKARRAVSMIITYAVYITVVFMFMRLVVPQIAHSYSDFVSRMQSYAETAQTWVTDLLSSIDFIDIDMGKFSDIVNDIIMSSLKYIQDIVPNIISFAGTFVSQIMNLLLGLIFSVYFLASKEKISAQCKKFMYAFIQAKKVDKTIEYVKFTDKTFGGFIIGKILDSIIIGIMTFVVLWISKMPYYPLVSVIIGVTNVIPFFGPIIGAIPSAFIIFIADPVKTIWFAVIILIIQQIDGNIIGPKILGDSTGLSAVWVIIAITLTGGLFGVLGMFFGVPAFAVIYYIVKRIIELLLRKRELPVETSDYEGDDKI